MSLGPSRAERAAADQSMQPFRDLVGARVPVLMDLRAARRIVHGVVVGVPPPAHLYRAHNGKHCVWHRMVDVELDGLGVWRVDVARLRIAKRAAVPAGLVAS